MQLRREFIFERLIGLCRNINSVRRHSKITNCLTLRDVNNLWWPEGTADDAHADRVVFLVDDVYEGFGGLAVDEFDPEDFSVGEGYGGRDGEDVHEGGGWGFHVGWELVYVFDDGLSGSVYVVTVG